MIPTSTTTAANNAAHLAAQAAAGYRPAAVPPPTTHGLTPTPAMTSPSGTPNANSLNMNLNINTKTIKSKTNGMAMTNRNVASGSGSGGIVSPPPLLVPVKNQGPAQQPHPPPPSHPNDVYLWKMSAEQVRNWIRGLIVFFPKQPKLRMDKNGNLIAALGKDASRRDNEEDLKLLIAEQQKLQKEEQENYILKTATAETLLNNLIAALSHASIEPPGNADTNGRDAKRIKTDSGASSHSSNNQQQQRDMYQILDPSFAQGKDIVHIPGAILARLTHPGLVNALAGQISGIVHLSTGKRKPLHTLTTPNQDNDTPIPTANHLSLTQLQTHAKTLHRAISARLEIDMMNSTPSRILEMLCPEVSLTEIMGIRKRIYDTVVLGRGTHSSATAAASEHAEDLPVAARVGMHDIEKFQKCIVCGNNDQASFVLDRKNGDLICTDCGTVATESLMHEGSQFRKFEGEIDRNHHGDTANPLYSNAHNMSTTLGGVGFATGAGIGGFGSGAKRGMENVLRNAHAYTEMNISQFGKEEKKTRVGYKDRQKKDAFVKMTHVGDALSLHQAVLQRAKELFAGFRDDRELVQQFKGVVAACLCEAFDQLSKDGRQILRMRAGEEVGEENGGEENGGGAVAAEKLNARASKRSEMHSSSLAGRGGLLLNGPDEMDKEAMTKGDASNHPHESSPAVAVPMSAMEQKAAPSWTLDDARSWLLEASRSIARQWSEQQTDDAIPKGTLNELEGKLVEHTFVLCDLLERELTGSQMNTNGGAGRSKQRVATPRVNEMGRLGIRWQHAHERGSGGAGGVGNSGRFANGTKPGPGGANHLFHRERTAGQILILKTAKKMGDAIRDRVAGDAFHRELRALLGRQEARKKKEKSDEAARLRKNQMKRKPWLQARVQS